MFRQFSINSKSDESARLLVGSVDDYDSAIVEAQRSPEVVNSNDSENKGRKERFNLIKMKQLINRNYQKLLKNNPQGVDDNFVELLYNIFMLENVILNFPPRDLMSLLSTNKKSYQLIGSKNNLILYKHLVEETHLWKFNFEMMHDLRKRYRNYDIRKKLRDNIFCAGLIEVLLVTMLGAGLHYYEMENFTPYKTASGVEWVWVTNPTTDIYMDITSKNKTEATWVNYIFEYLFNLSGDPGLILTSFMLIQAFNVMLIALIGGFDSLFNMEVYFNGGLNAVISRKEKTRELIESSTYDQVRNPEYCKHIKHMIWHANKDEDVKPYVAAVPEGNELVPEEAAALGLDHH